VSVPNNLPITQTRLVDRRPSLPTVLLGSEVKKPTYYGVVTGLGAAQSIKYKSDRVEPVITYVHVHILPPSQAEDRFYEPIRNDAEVEINDHGASNSTGSESSSISMCGSHISSPKSNRSHLAGLNRVNTKLAEWSGCPTSRSSSRDKGADIAALCPEIHVHSDILVLGESPDIQENILSNSAVPSPPPNSCRGSQRSSNQPSRPVSPLLSSQMMERVQSEPIVGFERHIFNDSVHSQRYVLAQQQAEISGSRLSSRPSVRKSLSCPRRLSNLDDMHFTCHRDSVNLTKSRIWNHGH
jgi:hypothetical protein